jgi:hypothetical protein
LDPVRVGRVVDGGEVGQLVVEQEAAARDEHPGAAGLLDGQGVLHDVAPSVGHREVRGLDVLGVFCLDARGRGGGAVTVVARDVPRGDGRDERPRLADRAGSLGGEGVGEQVLQWYVDVRRVAEVLRPVGERQRGGLEVVVQRRAHVHGPDVVALHDVQRLPDR